MNMVGRIDAEKFRAWNAAAQALIAAGQRNPRQDDAVDKHLKRQRDKGEVDLLQPHAYGADDGRNDGRERERAEEGNRDRHARALHDQAEAVSAEPEEHAVPE